MGSKDTELAKALKYEVYYFRSLLFSENTKKAYRTHRDSFLRFCLHMGYSPFPATLDIICQYSAFLARTFKVSSVRNYLHIIGLLHKEFGLKNPLADNWVLDTLLKGMKHAKVFAVDKNCLLQLICFSIFGIF